MKLTTKILLTTLVTLMVLSASLVSALYYQPNLLSNHPFLQQLAQQLTAYQETTAEDKVYLHFDKKFFEPGEDIWFNAYIRDAKSFQASLKSEVVYVQLLSPQGSVEQELTLIAQKGQGQGTFALPETLKGGLYTIKAYTKWQANSQTFFKREITIQKAVLPNLNMKLNFNKKAYGVGEKVTATLDLNTLTKEALANHTFDYVVTLDGQEVARKKGKTNDLGRAYVQFNLPKKLATNDGLLNVLLPYKGQTESIARSIPIVLGNINLDFYPEGGELVAGMTSNIGFKALNEFGKPADVSGHIFDQRGNKVATFGSYYQGMGKFTFTPQEGQQYQAYITSPANSGKSYPLPLAKTSGYVLEATQKDKKSLQVTVKTNQEEELYLVAQSRNSVQFSQVLTTQKGSNLVNIPTQDFPIGITQITLFDQKKVARAERLVFVNPNKQLNIELITDKEKYLPREQVNMTLKVTNEKGQPVSGDFSLAVVDDKLLNFADDKQGHLLSYMLLESDLKGEIVQPNFYFDKEDDPTRLQPEIDRQEALDQLMLTQGWRKFIWEEVTTNKYSKPTQEGELAKIAGTVLDAKGNPIAGIAIKLGEEHKAITTNAKGQFNIEDWELYQSVNLQASSKDYYTAVQHLEEYKNNLRFQLFKKRTITGVVKGKNKEALAGIAVRAAGITATTTNAKGEFKLMIPDNVQQLQFYGGGYNSINIPLKDSDQLQVVLSEQQLVYAETLSAVRGVRRNQVFDAPPAPLGRQVEAVEVEQPDFAPEDDAFDVLEDDEEIVEIEDEEEQEEIVEEVEVVIDDEIAMGAKKEVAAKFPDRLVRDEPFLADGKVQAAVIRTTNTRYNRVRAFPTLSYENAPAVNTRTDFRSTIYWNPNVVVKNGEATINFYNNDAITQFRITVEGFGAQGQIGRVEHQYFTQLPFEMLTKVPREVLTGDKINIPLTLTNNTNTTLKGQLSIQVPPHLKLLKAAPKTIQLAAGASKTLLLEAEVLNKTAEGDLIITLKANGLVDRFKTTIVANPRGFPVQEVFTGDQMKESFPLTIQEVLEGSLTAKLQVYPSTLDEVMNGMESMLRMPSGCFEQTSSSNYPNLLVLDYLRETNTSLPALEEKVGQYLGTGYQRLTGYESPSGGFDWWGRDPGHEALSAYGLMEFVDMKRVYPVDQSLIDRTAKWLLSRRDGKGGWIKNTHALHSWALAEVTDAYIVWAITEAGYAQEIQKELNQSYKDAIKSEDPYRLALLANALFKAKDQRANTLLQELVKLQKKDGSFMGLTSSVTNSTGQSLMVETSSLTVLAMLQSKGYDKNIQSALKAIQGGKNSYGYGSTQGTVLALKALLEYAKGSKKTSEAGDLLVFVDGKQVTSLSYTPDQKEIVLPNFGKHLKNGRQKITVQYANTTMPMPWDVEITYTTRLPQNSSDCPFSLETKLPKAQVNMGENIRLSTTLVNTTDKGQPMTMAMIGIPAGLSVQAWQLKELQEKKVFDYYELFEGYVVLHYEQMTPNQSKTVHLDLKADIPGNYEAPASSAFLYYTNEHKVWAQPERLVIN
ncbi:MAG: MG2 domain-containing protein [Aureispira sp.]